jgi:hypothetical protein
MWPIYQQINFPLPSPKYTSLFCPIRIEGIQMKSANAFNAILDIYVSPSKTFNGLSDAKGWSWIAFACVIVATMLSIFVYYTAVDMQFVVDEQVAIASVDESKSATEAIRSSIEETAPYLVWINMAGTFVTILIINAVMATYYMLTSKLDPESNQSFGEWYGFSFWTMMPAVIASSGSIALILTAGTDQIPISVLNFSSLNQLIFGLELEHPFYGLLEGLTLFSLWNIVLAMIGLKCWTNFSTGKTLLFAMLPSILLFGTWAIIVLL